MKFPEEFYVELWAIQDKYKWNCTRRDFRDQLYIQYEEARDALIKKYEPSYIPRR